MKQKPSAVGDITGAKIFTLDKFSAIGRGWGSPFDFMISKVILTKQLHDFLSDLCPPHI